MPLFEKTAQMAQQAGGYFTNPNVDIFANQPAGLQRAGAMAIPTGGIPGDMTGQVARLASDATKGILSGAATQAVGDVAKGGFGQMLKGAAANDAGAFGQVAQGLAGIAGGIIGGGARRREQREARAELARQREAYETFQFQDPTVNMTNPYEDLTVNLQQAQFESQQQQQALAGTLSGLSAAAGGSGIGALAQTIAQQQQRGLQAASASIGLQERENQLMRARGQQQLEQERAIGAQYVQEREFGRVEDLYSTAAARKAAADQARKQATEGLIGGIANIGVGAARIATAGGAI